MNKVFKFLQFFFFLRFLLDFLFSSVCWFGMEHASNKTRNRENSREENWTRYFDLCLYGVAEKKQKLEWVWTFDWESGVRDFGFVFFFFFDKWVFVFIKMFDERKILFVGLEHAVLICVYIELQWRDGSEGESKRLFGWIFSSLNFRHTISITNHSSLIT